MNWAYQAFYNTLPWNNFDGGASYTFAYPTMNGVIDTMEWEGFREGNDDNRYIATLQNTIASALISGDSAKAAAANSAQSYLNTLRVSILAGNTSDLDSMRSSVISNIESIISADTLAPTIPTNLTATAISISAINLTWTASTDDTAVTGYKIYRNGTQIGTSATNSYSDTELSKSTSYAYIVSAYDANGNNSSQSSSASATTNATPIVPSGGGGGGGVSCISQTPNPTQVATSTTTTTALSLPESATAIAVPQLSFPRALKFGSKGTDVSTLQKTLTVLGYGTAITGTYSTTTQNAVQKFQCAKINICKGNYNTTGYGRTGTATIKAIQTAYEKLNATPTPTTEPSSSDISFARTLRFGMGGDDVLLLQKTLNALGYLVSDFGVGSKGNETNYYGKQTQIAVQKFQCKVMNICDGNYTTTGYGRFGNTTKGKLVEVWRKR